MNIKIVSFKQEHSERANFTKAVYCRPVVTDYLSYNMNTTVASLPDE